MKIDKETGLEIKNCPFCGSEEIGISLNRNAWMSCCSCGADGPYKDTKRQAIQAWNRRYDPDEDDGR